MMLNLNICYDIVREIIYTERLNQTCVLKLMFSGKQLLIVLENFLKRANRMMWVGESNYRNLSAMKFEWVSVCIRAFVIGYRMITCAC